MIGFFSKEHIFHTSAASCPPLPHVLVWLHCIRHHSPPGGELPTGCSMFGNRKLIYVCLRSPMSIVARQTTIVASDSSFVKIYLTRPTLQLMLWRHVHLGRTVSDDEQTRAGRVLVHYFILSSFRDLNTQCTSFNFLTMPRKDRHISCLDIPYLAGTFPQHTSVQW